MVTLKMQWKDLAVLGGTPAFSEKLHVGRPNLGNRQKFLERVNDLLDRRWLSNDGPFREEFEKRVCDLIGVKHCIAMCNGTIALEILIRALDLKGEVILPSFTFVATAHALQWQEITPVFCDIDPDTHNVDPEKIEAMITPRTTGIIGVHLWGRACPVERLTTIAERNHLRLLFDASHAFGCSHEGIMCGNFGQGEIFSFHATKFLNTFEGGAVVTNHDDLARKVRLMKNFGFAGYDQVIYIGTNGKMNEISAAMGLTGLDSIEDFIGVNYRNYRKYQEELYGLPGIRMIQYEEKEKNNYQHIILEIDETITRISRDRLVEFLHAENVLARRYFSPGCHRMEPYRSLFPHAGLLLPETEKMAYRVLALPTGTAISEKDITVICQILRLLLEHGWEIEKRIG